jgi:dolichyl-phosphate-mannose--protein O-mannosyl transferase
MRSSDDIKGSGGVACFVRDSLRSKISLVSLEEFYRFMWVRVCGVFLIPRYIYIFFSYFPPTSSSYTIHNGHDEDPFIDLYADIIHYMVVGEVVLLGDFNSHTIFLHIPLHDHPYDMFCM